MQRPRNRLWILFFLILALLALFAIVVPIVYNENQLLRPEQLAEARRRWSASGPKDYDMWWEFRYTQSDGNIIRHRWMMPIRNGQAYYPPEDGPVHEYRPTVEEIFDRIARDLAADAARTDRRNYTVATFDDRDGHTIRYVHRIAGSKEEMQWHFRLTPPGVAPDVGTSTY